MEEKIKINFGSGHWKLDGWTNVDLDAGSKPDVVADLSAALPFKSGVANLIHTEDFIDQLELENAERFMKECFRILVPGGVLRVLTPDLRKLASLYLNDPGELKKIWREHVGVPLRLGTAGEVLNLGMRFAGHTFLYDEDSFRELAWRCGFQPRKVQYRQSEIPGLRDLDFRSPETALSMYFDCYRHS